MKTTYEVLMPAGTIGHGEVDWPMEPSFTQIRALIDPILSGEPIERVVVLHKGQRTDMLVSEVGHLQLTTRPPLAINPQATKIYRHNWLTQNPGADPDSSPTIAGIAVLFGRRIWF